MGYGLDLGRAGLNANGSPNWSRVVLSFSLCVCASIFSWHCGWVRNHANANYSLFKLTETERARARESEKGKEGKLKPTSACRMETKMQSALESLSSAELLAQVLPQLWRGVNGGKWKWKWVGCIMCCLLNGFRLATVAHNEANTRPAACIIQTGCWDATRRAWKTWKALTEYEQGKTKTMVALCFSYEHFGQLYRQPYLHQLG